MKPLCIDKTVFANAQKLFCQQTLCYRLIMKRVGSLPQNAPDRLWGPHGLPFKEYRYPFPGTKRPGREASHSTRSSTQVRNDRIDNFTPLYSFTACARTASPCSCTITLRISRFNASSSFVLVLT
jgi:hypothetical protein